MSDTTGTDKVRELMERALRAGSLHVPNGNFLFEVYIEFEKLILMSLKVETNYLLLIYYESCTNIKLYGILFLAEY